MLLNRESIPFVIASSLVASKGAIRGLTSTAIDLISYNSSFEHFVYVEFQNSSLENPHPV
jgi:hypothetical protein